MGPAGFVAAAGEFVPVEEPVALGPLGAGLPVLAAAAGDCVLAGFDVGVPAVPDGGLAVGVVLVAAFLSTGFTVVEDPVLLAAGVTDEAGLAVAGFAAAGIVLGFTPRVLADAPEVLEVLPVWSGTAAGLVPA